MKKVIIGAALLAAVVAALFLLNKPRPPASNSTSVAQPAPATHSGETRYLMFQIMTGLPGYAGPPPPPGHSALTKSQLSEFVRSIIGAIGEVGDERHALGFTIGPLCLDMSDAETEQFVRDAFAVARENSVAVAFHIDDSMTWGQRTDLTANPDNIETAGWNERPNTGRRADWGPEPTRFPPQMCFNSEEVRAAVLKRAAVIGAEITKQVQQLHAAGQPHLFAGVIAGWETCIGRDFDTGRPLGYRAMMHRGFSASSPPPDADMERVQIVKEFIELWSRGLHVAGVSRDKTFCHIAFTSQGLREPDATDTFAQNVQFAIPEIAFSDAYRPGFSTYPEGSTFKDISSVLAAHASPGWISAEGTNVSPSGMPGEASMETYLARMFNHGAVMTNVFSWGIGGDAMRDNFFRKATEGPEAIAAYRKFLRREALIEAAPSGFSAQSLPEKMHRLQRELAPWAQRSGQQAKVGPLAERLDALLKAKKWQEADRVADELLSMLNGETKK